MCNYSVLKCLIDYAQDNRPADFQAYINAVNTKGETALHYISILPTSSGKRLVSQHTFLTEMTNYQQQQLPKSVLDL